MSERKFVQFVGGHVEKGRHLVDERTRTAGTGTVHAFVAAAVEEDDFRVFPAEFDDGGGFGFNPADDFPGRPYFLNERDAGGVCQTESRRTGESRREGFTADDFSGFAHETGEGLADLCKVADVAFKQEFSLFYNGDFCRGGTDVQPNRKVGQSMIIKCAVQQIPHHPLVYI